jgi:hypothetical protein
MTDYQACLEAADWRLEQIKSRLESTSAISTTHALAAERNRLRRFARFCMLARTFDQ